MSGQRIALDTDPLTGLRSRYTYSWALIRLQREAGKWRGEKGELLKLAAGYALAADHPGLTSEKLVNEADLQMYEAKAEYYRKTGLD